MSPLVEALEHGSPEVYVEALLKLTAHEVLRASGKIEEARLYAERHGIAFRQGRTPWPSPPLPPPSPYCTRPLSNADVDTLRARYRGAMELVDDCIEAQPTADPRKPPALHVALLSRPDGSTEAVNASGIAVDASVVECAIRAAERLRVPAFDSGYRVYQWMYRPG